MRALLAIVCAAALAGCVTRAPEGLYGFALSRDARGQGATFRVLHRPNDSRNLDTEIATQLRRHGLEIVEASGGEPDYEVSYIDHWDWDLRLYLLDLRIDVRDSRNGVLVGAGRSYQVSAAALGTTYQDVVSRTVELLFIGEAAPLEQPADAPAGERL